MRTRSTSGKVKAPWYCAGLQFECTGCGYCCSGQPGYVYVNQEEIEALSQFLQIGSDEFELHFVRFVGKDKSLIERPNGDCIFLDSVTRHCMVYDLRPRQCRSYPFWPSIVKSRPAWLAACRTCLGCGKGRLFTREEIDRYKSMIDV